MIAGYNIVSSAKTDPKNSFNTWMIPLQYSQVSILTKMAQHFPGPCYQGSMLALTTSNHGARINQFRFIIIIIILGIYNTWISNEPMNKYCLLDYSNNLDYRL